MKIGVLSLQGAIEEHERSLTSAANKLEIDLEVNRVILPKEIQQVDGLVLPGGESTAMIKIGTKNGMLDAVRSRLTNGLPTFGTCAGAILLSKEVRASVNSTITEGAFPFLDVEILRNGYGSQRDSFSTQLTLINQEKKFHGVFIRAPVFSTIGNQVKVLSSFNNNPVLIQQGNILASTFHPELTENSTIHEYFLKII
ncbi:MAG: pyridoxal 5'-phosphate synthase glutaminase subunit PdxT [Candidatus Kariarchaeaceae archaeon]|jgi:5'-phosphate synthase pdxT subunit